MCILFVKILLSPGSSPQTPKIVRALAINEGLQNPSHSKILDTPVILVSLILRV